MGTRDQMRHTRPETRKEKLYGKGAVRYTLPNGLNGPINLRIDFGLAASPAIYYYANALSLRQDQPQAMVLLSFGCLNGKELRRNSVNVVLPEVALFNHFWNSTRDVEQALDQQLKALGRPVPEAESVPGSAFSQTLYANSTFVSVGSGESCLDFYYLPPKDLHLARTRGANIELYPIIRITLSNFLLKRLFNMCRPHAMPAVAPQLVTETKLTMGRNAKRAKSR